MFFSDILNKEVFIKNKNILQLNEPTFRFDDFEKGLETLFVTWQTLPK